VNLPNLLTLSRIPILFGIVALLMLSTADDPLRGASSGAFILFILGALTDWADGYVARQQGLVSNFGKLMDALTDKVFMVGLFIALLVLGVLPQVWALPLLLLILSREFLITGLRLVAASSGVVLAAEKSGKHKTVSQIIAAVLLLSAMALQQDFPEVVAAGVSEWLHLAGLTFFVVATLLTVSSGTLYMVKYWSVFTGQDTGTQE
jgi:CDP-diacylglycerol--glycerol-3-phosphate 3-phosphatidyltransferase